MKKSLSAIAALLGCIASLNASVIYVANDGTGSGASWEDPASVQSAFQTVAEKGGGEIWLKEGFYSLTASLALSSNMTLRGGFAGTETQADAADPAAHPTIFSAIPEGNLSLYQWSSNTVRVADSPVWSGGVFTLRRPDDETTICRYPTIGNGSVGFKENLLTTPQVSVGVKISGITFTGSRTSALVVSAGSEVELEKCRFLACGVGTTAIAGPGAIDASGTLSATECDFIGCAGAVALQGTDSAKTNLFVDCVFDGCTGASTTLYAGAIYATGKQPLKILGCTFANNVGVSRANRSGVAISAAAISYTATSGALFIADTCFESNRLRALDGSQATPNACLFTRSPATVERCLFKNNSIKGEALDADGVQHRAVCLYAMGVPVTVRDSVFSGNTLSGKTALATGHRWASAAVIEKKTGIFVNCAFYGNTSILEATTEDGKSSHACGVVNVIRSSNGEDSGVGASFINCLLTGNQFAGNLARAAEVYLDDGTDTRFTLSFINTVIWSKEAAHKAYFANAAYPVSISHAVLMNTTAAAMTNGNDYVEYLSAADPSVSEKVFKKNGTYRFDGMRGLNASSSFAKKGMPIYEKDGSFYFYAPGQVADKPWRRCHLKSGSLATLEGATLVNDAFGEARLSERYPYGPVVHHRAGFSVILR